MPSDLTHIALANRNQKTLDHLKDDVKKNAEWIVTVAFYKALHIVEAIFFHSEAVPGTGRRHVQDHGERDFLLKSGVRFEEDSDTGRYQGIMHTHDGGTPRFRCDLR